MFIPSGQPQKRVQLGNYTTVRQAEEGSSDGVTEISEIFSIENGAIEYIRPSHLALDHERGQEKYSSYRPISLMVQDKKKSVKIYWESFVAGSQLSSCLMPQGKAHHTFIQR